MNSSLYEKYNEYYNSFLAVSNVLYGIVNGNVGGKYDTLSMLPMSVRKKLLCLLYLLLLLIIILRKYLKCLKILQIYTELPVIKHKTAYADTDNDFLKFSF